MGHPTNKDLKKKKKKKKKGCGVICRGLCVKIVLVKCSKMQGI